MNQAEQAKFNAVAAAEFPGVEPAKCTKFISMIQGEPYITGAGLQYKMLDLYGQGKFSIQSLMPSAEEYALLRRMLNLPDTEPLCVLRGEVWVDGFERPFVDYGTTSPKNLRGFVKFSDYPLEMAARRATNRAMRLATACGTASVDEINQDAPQAPAEPPSVERGEADATQEQIHALQLLSKSEWLTTDEKASTLDALSGDISAEKAKAAIDILNARIDVRAEEAAAQAAKDADPPEDANEDPPESRNMPPERE